MKWVLEKSQASLKKRLRKRVVKTQSQISCKASKQSVTFVFRIDMSSFGI